jgi:hypothetical protein
MSSRRMSMKKWNLWMTAISLVAAAALFTGPQGAYAFGDGTPDTDPPAEEEVCNDLGGRLWGLCVAYCEAQDCPASEHPSCDVLRDKLYDLTGGMMFPCDGGGPGIS